MQNNQPKLNRLVLSWMPADKGDALRTAVILAAIILLVFGMLTAPRAQAATGIFRTWQQDFEADTAGWIDDAVSPGYGLIEQVESMAGVPGAHTGTGFAVVNGLADECRFSPGETCYYGPFTRFDGYRSFWTGPWTAELSVYLDPAWAAGSGFDYSVAANNTSGAHRRDFIFHVTKDTSTGSLLVGGSNNSNDRPRENLESGNHYVVNTAGWYVLQHVFSDNSGILSVDLNLLDDNGSLLWTETRTNLGDVIPGVVGGNRYGWFVHVTVPGGLAIDSHQLHNSYAEGGYDAAALLKGAVRYRNLASDTGGEIYLGLAGLQPGSRVEKDFYRGSTCEGENPYGSWQAENHITLAYDPQTGQLITVVNASHNYCLEYPVGDLGVLNYLKLSVVNRGTGTAVALNNATVNGYSIGDLPAVGWQDFMVTGIDLTEGFVLEGDLVLGGTQPSSDELNKVEIAFGVSDQFGPRVTDLQLSPAAAGGSASEFTITAELDDTPVELAPADQPALANKVASAEYTLVTGALDGSETWTPMGAQDGAFEEVDEGAVEIVTATATVPATSGDYLVCVRGTDNLGNLGEADCAPLVIDLDPPLLEVEMPASVFAGESFELQASADDTTTGNQAIVGMAYSFDSSTWNVINPLDGDYDSAVEAGSVNVPVPLAVGTYALCVVAEDALGNQAQECGSLAVVDDSLISPDDFLGGMRLRNLSALDQGRGGRELFLGIPDLGRGDQRSEVDLIYAAENAITFEYQPQQDRLLATVENDHGQTQLEYPQYTAELARVMFADDVQMAETALSLINFMQFQVYSRDPNTASQVDLIDVHVNGLEVGDFVGQNGTGLTWQLADLSLSSGFTLTGTLNLAGITSTSQELSRVEVDFGFIDTYAPELVAVLTPDETGLGSPIVDLAITADEQFRGWSDIQSIQVSLDGGISWETVVSETDSLPDRVTITTNYQFAAPSAAGVYPVLVQAIDLHGNLAQIRVDLLVVDDQAPVLMLTIPGSALPQAEVQFTVTASDQTTGAGIISSLEYQIDSGDWQPMTPQDGSFDGVEETAAGQVNAPNADRDMVVCARGSDQTGNQSAPVCETVAVGAGPVLTVLDYSLSLPIWHTAGIQVQAEFSDVATGGSPIAVVEISLDGGLSWMLMEPADVFDTAVESAHFTGELLLPIDQYTLCLQAEDAAGYRGDMECTQLTQQLYNQAIFIPVIGHQFRVQP